MLNVSIQQGRLTKAPELRTTPSGLSVCTFSIAVKEETKNQSGEYDSSFFDIVTWRQTAEYAASHLAKGQMVTVVGRLKQRSWEDNGQKRTKIEIVANNVYPGEKPGDKPAEQRQVQFTNIETEEGELPF